jgi:hypothetical protein
VTGRLDDLADAARRGGYAELRHEVQRRLVDGVTAAELYEDLEAVRSMVDEHEEVEDSVLDVMDELVGWCSPHLRLDGD